MRQKSFYLYVKYISFYVFTHTHTLKYISMCVWTHMVGLLLLLVRSWVFQWKSRGINCHDGRSPMISEDNSIESKKGHELEAHLP